MKCKDHRVCEENNRMRTPVGVRRARLRARVTDYEGRLKALQAEVEKFRQALPGFGELLVRKAEEKLQRLKKAAGDE